jgi:hypothetical protein
VAAPDGKPAASGQTEFLAEKSLNLLPEPAKVQVKVLREDGQGSVPGEAWLAWAAVAASPLLCREARCRPSFGGTSASGLARQPNAAAGGGVGRPTATPEPSGDA